MDRAQSDARKRDGDAELVGEGRPYQPPELEVGQGERASDDSEEPAHGRAGEDPAPVVTGGRPQSATRFDKPQGYAYLHYPLPWTPHFDEVCFPTGQMGGAPGGAPGGGGLSFGCFFGCFFDFAAGALSGVGDTVSGVVVAGG